MNSTEWFKPGTDKRAAMSEIEKAAARNAARPVPSMMLLDPEERKEVRVRFSKTEDDALIDDYAHERAAKSFDHVERERKWTEGLVGNANAFYEKLVAEQARIRKYEDAVALLQKQLFKIEFETTARNAMFAVQQSRQYSSGDDFYGHEPELSGANSGKNAALEADLKKTVRGIQEKLLPMREAFADGNRRYAAMLRQEGSEADLGTYESQN